ncbi:MAG: 30S ribosomal protein S6 [Acidimicrobiales bacterium]
MRFYEVAVIIDPVLEDEVIRVEIDKAVGIIRDGGGKVGRTDRWGRRRLAYEIADRREGYYVIIEASAESTVMDQLDRSLRLSDAVLRHKIIRIPDHIAGRTSRRSPGADAGPAPVASGRPSGPAEASTRSSKSGE